MSAIQEWFYPELKRFEHYPDRARAEMDYGSQLVRRWPTWIAIALLALLFGPAAPFAVNLGVRQLGLGTTLWSAVLIGGVIGVLQVATFMLIFNLLFRRPYRRFLRRRLSELGLPTCVGCGYDLRGQVVARCPECGEPFA
ncbi:MAG: hypothetical protein LC135_11320 [Phycisphaerae bacterium]|jgi:hypothetical protein|nr:hypothetical protein [Phycisphaerae bacterium]MCZ2400438.1 hypothetical protein [Phycisphaerae bacterium]NUQ50314.1 hypothetical protein [Phycisphaerae bacterium]